MPAHRTLACINFRFLSSPLARLRLPVFSLREEASLTPSQLLLGDRSVEELIGGGPNFWWFFFHRAGQKLFSQEWSVGVSQCCETELEMTPWLVLPDKA
jgi:hypothetical protein